MDIGKLQASQSYITGKGILDGNTSPDVGRVERTLGQAAESFADVLAKGEATAQAAMVGNADPTALVEALARSQMAVETVVTIRDRVVEAYKEILHMQV